ncbi:hypothetical protein, partial [uncultured Parabacteroides sp.]|uniref:hypothetical protein n=1 Tax=uncultured Parabacteroides sp. TaxID=512312 RepID=UPI0026256A54
KGRDSFIRGKEGIAETLTNKILEIKEKRSHKTVRVIQDSQDSQLTAEHQLVTDRCEPRLLF